VKIGQRRDEEIMDIRDAMQNGIGIDALRAVQQRHDERHDAGHRQNQRPTMKALRSRKKSGLDDVKATGGGPSRHRASTVRLVPGFFGVALQIRNGTEKLAVARPCSRFGVDAAGTRSRRYTDAIESARSLLEAGMNRRPDAKARPMLRRIEWAKLEGDVGIVANHDHAMNSDRASPNRRIRKKGQARKGAMHPGPLSAMYRLYSPRRS